MLHVYSLGSRVKSFVRHETKGKKCYTENEAISMLELLINNIFVEFGGHIDFFTNHGHPHGNK